MFISQVKQFGFLKESLKTSDDFFGGISRSDNQVLVEDGDWTKYLPTTEYQSNELFDTFSCVTFSALNCIETLWKRKFEEEKNFSDRFTAKMSGTTKQGNYMSSVASSIRHDGLLKELLWNFPRDIIFTWEEYFVDIPDYLKEQAKEIFKYYNITSEWVEKDKLKEALRYSPLQVSVYAWPEPVDGAYKDVSPIRNHLVMLFNFKDGEYWEIFDTYDNVIKRLEWDYSFNYIMKYNVNSKIDMDYKNNTLIQLVEGTGGFGLYVQGKLYVDDLGKVLASWLVRNSGKIEGMTGVATQIQWDALSKFNLKNEPI